MANLTISVDDEVLKQARIRALEQGTSVNALLREYLEAYAGVRQRQEEAIQDLLQLSQSTKSRGRGRKWTRGQLPRPYGRGLRAGYLDELHER